METPLPPHVLADLRRRHAEPQRHYHTWAHVQALLDWLDRVHGDLADAAAVELAVLYHDAVYDPRATDNEARSADLLLADLSGHVAPARLARARAMILATADHEPLAADDAGLTNDGLTNDGLANDAAHFLDMDLSILGAEPAVFDAYQAAIRREYAFVSEADYRRGRSAVLRAFLDRDRLFLTDRFHGALDAAARANLRRGLARLAAG